MELVLLSGPGLVMTPTATDARAWAIAGLVCAAILLADAVVATLVRRRSGSSRWPLSVLLPAALACASLVYAWRTWAVADSFPSVPRSGGVTGSDCVLCRTLNGYATVGELVVGATLLVLLGGAVYLLGEVD
ncbi:MAG TPA: hypothetical protein VJN88_02490 [Ktedonobacterales bacterium]|nr:hypothetical protein [Ktedonobacterales bacterium]